MSAPVGNANHASSASCGCTSASRSNPFGTAVGNSNGSGADRTNASTFGQRTSIFGGFGEAATSTTPLFGHPGPSFNTFRGGGGPATADNSCGGTRAPYRPTPAEENHPSWNNHSHVLASISAMNCYCNKSHEELRSEVYKQTRNGDGGPAIADNSCGGIRAPYRPTPAEENLPSWNNACPVLTSISAMKFYCNKSHEELRSENYKQTRSGGPSSAAHVPGVSNPLPNPISVSSRSPFQPGTFEWLPPPREPLAFTFNRSSENPIQRTDPSSSLGSDKNRTTPVQISPVQTSVAQTLPSPTPTTTTNPAVMTSHVSPSAAGVLGGESSNLSKSAPPTPTNTAPSGSAPLLDFFSQVIQDSSSIPKGLEIIAQHLGFNPWEGKNNLQDSQTGHILLCEDASDDPDILSLAEFAVEQHNAMDKDGKVELLKVTAACLEAVDGGRYHIILDAEPPASSIVRVTCFYAAVLQKNTDRPTPLIVLESWLPSRYWSSKK